MSYKLTELLTNRKSEKTIRVTYAKIELINNFATFEWKKGSPFSRNYFLKNLYQNNWTKYVTNDNDNTFSFHVEIGREPTQVRNELVNAVRKEVLPVTIEDIRAD